VDYQQSYKNRAEAYRLFIKGQNLGVGQSKFYNDCDLLKLVNPDKSIGLSALLAYVRKELNVDLTTGQSLVQKSTAEETAQLELRKLRAETEKKERDNEESSRDLDNKWLHRDVVEERLAALVGVLHASLEHQVGVGVSGVIHVAGGDPARREETVQELLGMVDAAFAEMLVPDLIEGVFHKGGEDEE